MAGIIGKKIGMSSFFDQDGKSIPCTMIEAGPCIVTQIKKLKRMAILLYNLGSKVRIRKKIKKSEIGHVKMLLVNHKIHTLNLKITTPRTNNEGVSEHFEPNVGDTVGVDIFNEGEFVDVTSTSKGKGFQGVIQRHGFAGVGDTTRSTQQIVLRFNRCSILSTRVFKGMRMAGRMGGRRSK